MSEQLAYYSQVSVRSTSSLSFVDVRSVKIVLPFVLSRSPPLDDGFRDVVVSGVGVAGLDYVLYSSSFGASVSSASSANSSSSSNSAAAVVLSSMSSSQGYSVSAVVSYDYSGRSLSNVGDFNGDGWDDVIIGVPYLSRCYVMFGTETGFKNLSLGFMVHGVSSADLAGWSVSGAGDVNQDGYADILIGAPRAVSLSGAMRPGAAYVLYGSSGVFRDVYLDDLSASDGFVMYGESAEDCLGLSVASAGDVNGDGYDDVVLGSARISSFYAGGAYVVYGFPSGAAVGSSMLSMSVSELTASKGLRLLGSSWSHCGFSVSGAGDVNSDGYDDVLVGCVPMTGSARLSEVSYLVYGVSVGRNVSELSLASGVSGVSVISGGGVFVSDLNVDINNDGVRDLLIGSNYSLAAGVGYVIVDTMFKYAPSARPSVRPSAAPSTLQPSVKPFRSGVPSAMPVCAPSRGPSVAPSRPSAAPTVRPSGPSQCPTSRPTSYSNVPSSRPSSQPSQSPVERIPSCVPSNSPSIVTDNPTSVPTFAPSAAPSNRTITLLPTEPPSVAPTVRPTSGSPTVYPTLIPRVGTRPTFSPTFTVTLKILASLVVNVSVPALNKTSNTLYGDYVWDTCSSTGLTKLNGRGSYRGDTIRIKPLARCKLEVQHFNATQDVLDLTAFPQYVSYHDLNMTRGSVVITLVNNQVLRLVNVLPEDLGKSNFLFLPEPDSPPQANYNVVILCSIIGFLFLLFMGVRYYISWRKQRKVMKIAEGVIARQKPLVTHTHSLYKHSLIGKRHRPVLFEIRELDSELPDELKSEDSLLEHEESLADSSDADSYHWQLGDPQDPPEYDANYDEDFQLFKTIDPLIAIEVDTDSEEFDGEIYDQEEEQRDFTENEAEEESAIEEQPQYQPPDNSCNV